MVECGSGTLDDADLRRDLRGSVQDLSDPGQQVDSADRGPWRRLPY